jgi:hypothetical protein
MFDASNVSGMNRSCSVQQNSFELDLRCKWMKRRLKERRQLSLATTKKIANLMNLSSDVHQFAELRWDRNRFEDRAD